MNGSGDLVRNIWGRKGFWGALLWFLLVPSSFLYGCGVRFRNLLYDIGWMPTKRLPCAVISVGNLTVGGTGKTPTSVWLARELTGRGYRVAILSRGYKRAGRQPTLLGPGFRSSSELSLKEQVLGAGDEPLMMAKLFDLRVGVGKKRYEVGLRMLQQREVDVFVMDDGFQHRRLKRDLDLLLLGKDWNGWLLPSGPFREPRSAARRAAAYLVTDARDKWESFLGAQARPSSLFFGGLRAKSLLGLDGDQWKEYPLSVMAGKRLVTVSAIADRTVFYRMIDDWEGKIADSLEFPDHHFYTPQDWQKINRSSREADLIITTEKDLLKLIQFPFARDRLFALRVVMEVENKKSLVVSAEHVIQSRKGNG